jgi:ion channel-forming bestrophin family protein
MVSEWTPHKLQFSNQMLTVLGTVLGLVISFRTSSAYERFQEGRRMWSNIMVASRNIAMMVSCRDCGRCIFVLIYVYLQVWIHVPATREDKVNGGHKPLLESVIEKKSIINLVNNFHIFDMTID